MAERDIRIEELKKQLDQMQHGLEQMRNELSRLTAKEEMVSPSPEQVNIKQQPTAVQMPVEKMEFKPSEKQKISKHNNNFERFIGENLINKIGIAITVIGVGIGAKYIIENNLISPVMRIVLGYLAGAILLGFSIKLRRKFESFSAVLLGGAMAIMYFISFLAYSLYALYPQPVAFGLMVLFTILTVASALSYKNQVIAHIGMVGAYAVPFLLSDGSGKVAVLFSYMAIINIGILAIAFKQYWKALYNTAFGITWLIFLSWFTIKYNVDYHFGISLLFSTIFFIIFYLTFLAYKLLREEKFSFNDIAVLLINSFIFFSIGYASLKGHETGKNFLGLFTFINGLVHAAVSMVVYQKRMVDKNLLRLLQGLGLLFITLAIPVQLKGNWVTLLWAGEALVLLWVGKKGNEPFYIRLAYPLAILAFFSVIHDWDSYLSTIYSQENTLTPFLNIQCLSSILLTATLGAMLWLFMKVRHTLQNEIDKIFAIILPTIVVITTFFTFHVEIIALLHNIYPTNQNSVMDVHNSAGINLRFRDIWLLNYTMLFVSAVIALSRKKIVSTILTSTFLIIALLTALNFLVAGLYNLSELRDSSIGAASSISTPYLLRYITIALYATMLHLFFYEIKQRSWLTKFINFAELFVALSALWVLSSELINWLSLSGYGNSYKLGLSILWGLYAFMLIVIGMWKKKRHLRIGAIVLFSITLLKFFFYDISHLSTIAKTVVLVSLGVLLLVVSFFYHKYRITIFGPDTEE